MQWWNVGTYWLVGYQYQYALRDVQTWRMLLLATSVGSPWPESVLNPELYISAYCMFQLYGVFVHSQELLKVLSVGPHFSVKKCTIPFVFAHYGKVFMKTVIERAQEPSLTRWICFQQLLHIREVFCSCTNQTAKVCMHFREKYGFILLEGFHKLKCYFAYNPS